MDGLGFKGVKRKMDGVLKWERVGEAIQRWGLEHLHCFGDDGWVDWHRIGCLDRRLDGTTT